MSNIEYFLINLPETLTKKPKQIMETLTKSGNIELFESLVVQTIINYKWIYYTKGFFEKQFYVFLGFFMLNVFDVYYSLLNKTLDDENNIVEDSRIMGVSLTLKTLCTTILIYFL